MGNENEFKYDYFSKKYKMNLELDIKGKAKNNINSLGKTKTIKQKPLFSTNNRDFKKSFYDNDKPKTMS